MGGMKQSNPRPRRPPPALLGGGKRAHPMEDAGGGRAATHGSGHLLCGLCRSEDVGAKLAAGDLATGGALDRSAVVRGHRAVAIDPLPDEGRIYSESVGKGLLAA